MRARQASLSPLYPKIWLRVPIMGWAGAICCDCTSKSLDCVRRWLLWATLSAHHAETENGARVCAPNTPKTCRPSSSRLTLFVRKMSSTDSQDRLAARHPERSRWLIERRRCWRGRGVNGLPVGARSWPSIPRGKRPAARVRGLYLSSRLITAVPYAAEVVTTIYTWRAGSKA